MDFCLTKVLLDFYFIPKDWKHLICVLILHFFSFLGLENLTKARYPFYIWIIYGIFINLWLICCLSYQFKMRRNDNDRIMRIGVVFHIVAFFVTTYLYCSFFYFLFILLVFGILYELIGKRINILGQSIRI